ncbi:MAG: lipopolysaccharide kinase InaA family protein [Candidatus Hydrogenedentota bacterium]
MSEGFVKERVGRTFSWNGALYLERRESVDRAWLLHALETPGEELKRSNRSVTRRVENTVIKQSAPGSWKEAVKLTVQPGRRLRAWNAARRLRAHGVGAPQPLAYVERSLWGARVGNAVVLSYLAGCRDVEAYAWELLARNAHPSEIHGFFAGLADAVNALGRAGAFHQDLAGKNIYTADGEHFFFIDLDAIILDAPYTRERRLKNHVQLYDSFCDWYDNTFLEPFIRRMCPEDWPAADWLPLIAREQQVRRTRHENIVQRNASRNRPPIAGQDGRRPDGGL